MESSHDDTDLIPPFAYVMGHGDEMPMHQHTQGQLVYPATGVLSISTTRGIWIAPTNRAVWTPAGFEHSHSAYGTTDMRAIHIPGDLAEALPDQPTVMAVSPLLREVLMVMTDNSERHSDATNRLVRVAVDELVEAPEEPLHLPEPHDDRLRAVTDLLHANPSDTRSLAELGKVVGASERTLSRLFQTQLHMGFRQWRTQLRIHRSLVHLAAGDTITQTALACGWSNPSTFIEAFTAILGQTPGRYRIDTDTALGTTAESR